MAAGTDIENDFEKMLEIYSIIETFKMAGERAPSYFKLEGMTLDELRECSRPPLGAVQYKLSEEYAIEKLKYVELELDDGIEIGLGKRRVDLKGV